MVTYTATYSPEDNKLRLYASERLDAETYERVKAAGFKWAPKQELFVAPKWTPQREDLATELAGEIEAEEMTLAERAAEKAERLDGYAAKRHAEANAYSRRSAEISERFYMGQPILVGHHSERAARRDQEKMHAAERKAHKLAETANYWLYRAEGCERFANMKNDPRTRARRIKTLLAELRDLQRGINDAHRGLKIWETVGEDPAKIKEVFNRCRPDVTGGTYGAWGQIDSGELDPIEARAKAMAVCKLRTEGPTRRRWIEHTLNRLAYERGLLGDVKRYEGELTPVILQTFARTHGAEKPKASETDPGSFELESPVPLPLHLASGNVLDMTADEWRDLMQGVGYEVPAPKARKAVKPQAASLMNLTAEQAAQLQRIWNTRKAGGEMARRGYTFKERKVTETTQAIYSSNAKGSYGCCKAVEIDERGDIIREQWHRMERVRSGEPVARIRINTRGGELYGPDSVVHLTDKPAKPLPIDLDALEAEALAALEPKAPDFSGPFDPAKVGIKRIRQSVTQGEVLLTYDGAKLGQYGDKIELRDHNWHGIPDSDWIETARRIHAGEQKAAA